MHFKSAIYKLTFFYVIIVMLVSIIFSIALYQFSSRELDTALSRQNRRIQNMPMMPVFAPNHLRDFENTRMDQLEESSHNLMINLLAFNVLILFLSAGASYFLAKRTLKPIEEMMNMQNRFTADASHELRTPLTAMKTEIEVSLRDKKFTLDEARKLLGSNLEEISKLEALSDGLLSLAQYGSEKLPKEKVDLEKVIDSAYEKIEALAKDKEIDFEFNLQKAQILGDSQSLTQLAIILMDNAIKYSPRSTQVSVTLESEYGHATLKVQDHGVGIKPNDLPHVFNRFYRADESRSKEKTEGFGLGLSIAKKIVEAHSGTIHAESSGDGSIFTVKLPLAK